MIDKKSRRVVIINNIQSDTIDQAIFILKCDKRTPKPDINIANEAQTIINNYIKQVERLKTTKNSSTKTKKAIPRWLKFLLTSGMISGIIYFVIHSF